MTWTMNDPYERLNGIFLRYIVHIVWRIKLYYVLFKNYRSQTVRESIQKCVLSQIQQHIKSHHSKEIQFNKSYYKKVFGQQSIVFTLIHHFYDSSCFPLEKKKPWKYPYHSHRVFFMIYLILLAIYSYIEWDRPFIVVAIL